MGRKRASERRTKGSGYLFQRGSGGIWHAAFRDVTGKRKERSTGTTDRATADGILATWTQARVLAKAGLMTPTQASVAEAARKTLADHLSDYVRKLEVAGKEEKYVGDVKRHMGNCCKYTGWSTLADISPTGLNDYVAHLKGEGYKNASMAYAITVVKGFARWCVRMGRLASYPLDAVSRPNVEIDRQERRMLLPSEWPWLEAGTYARGKRAGQSAFERATMYKTAIETGLRGSELKALVRSQLVLDGDDPHVILRLAETKNKKGGKLSFSPDLATSLKQVVAGLAPAARVFHITAVSNLSQKIKADMRKARQLWLKAAGADVDERMRREASDFLAIDDHNGGHFTLHSLRHSAGSWAILQGADLLQVQRLMRHSNLTLLSKRYGHVLPDAGAKVARSIAELMKPDPESMKAVVGLDEPARPSAVLSAVECSAKGGDGLPSDAKGQSEDGITCGAGDDEPKTLKMRSFGNGVLRDAKGCVEGDSGNSGVAENASDRICYQA